MEKKSFLQNGTSFCIRTYFYPTENVFLASSYEDLYFIVFFEIEKAAN